MHGASARRSYRRNRPGSITQPLLTIEVIIRGENETSSEGSRIPSVWQRGRRQRGDRRSRSWRGCQLLSLSIESIRSHMTDQPPSDRFKTEMPANSRRFRSRPALCHSAESRRQTCHRTSRRASRRFPGSALGSRPKHAPTQSVEQQPQIEVPSPAPDPSTLLPHATAADPGIASMEEMAKPWSSKEFYFRNHLSGENIPALLIRLPTGSPSQSNGYWAFAQKSPFGNCQLEFVHGFG